MRPAKVIECEVPVASVLDRKTVQTAYFRDSYRAPLARADSSVIDVFFGVFGHRPSWMNGALIVRNRIAGACGLDPATDSELLDTQPKDSCRVGENIGPWPIFALTPTELVAGRDDKHLDFRLSILIEQADEVRSAVISTICTVHNWAGRVYLFFIVPFHKWGVKLLIRRAITARRL
jgi:Protein of unknown function (DUF2867)